MASRIFVLSSPGFFFFVFCCAPLGAATFRRGQSKNTKTTTQGVFFFAPAPAKGRGRRSPVGRRNGARAKKHQGVLFFCSGPGERQRKEKPRWAPARGQSKKKNAPWVLFSCSGPGPAPNGASPSSAFRRAGAKKKKNTLGGVFCVFALAPPKGRGAQRGATTKILCTPGDDSKTKNLETNDTGHEQKGATTKKTDRSARTVVVFFFAVAPPGRSLTQCGLGRFRQGPGGVCFFFFGCGPAQPGEPITKTAWCTTSGLKRPGGATAKKKKTPLPP